MNRRSLISKTSLIVIGIVFGAVLVSSADLVKQSNAKSNNNSRIGSLSSPIEHVNLNDFSNAFIEVAEKVTPSIVSIKVVSQAKENPHSGLEGFDLPFPFKEFKQKRAPQKHQGSGSGVIISEDGYILTNNHVVDNASSLEVYFSDKRKLNAKIIGTDPLTDLAVIKVEANNLPAAYLGDSESLKPGAWVLAIGNPMQLNSTVTAGIVSAIGRNINIIQDKEGYGVENFIQTDAVINPGNSGGALVDLSGAVIGINSAIATNGFSASYIGYGFAIPINMAKSVAEDLIENGEVNRGYIGIGIGEVDEAMAKAVGLDKPRGIIIGRILEDGAAVSEDIKSGDIILEVDGREVNRPNQLQSYVATKRANTEVELTLFRDGDEITRTLKLKARKKDKDDGTLLVGKEKKKEKEIEEVTEVNFDKLGLTITNMNEVTAKKYNIKNGIIVKDVERFSKAANQRLYPGAVITEVDKKKINSVKEFEKIVKRKKGKALLLKVKHENGNTNFVGLEIPE
ncbi:MAG: Do family serine endopeptidase [Melioribacteraceae bacterium]